MKEMMSVQMYPEDKGGGEEVGEDDGGRDGERRRGEKAGANEGGVDGGRRRT